ncbi:MAG: flagellar biosynthetic protein FliO [bacterium]|nr:flagellar biosynthetic protein FliO [bacterium]
MTAAASKITMGHGPRGRAQRLRRGAAVMILLLAAILMAPVAGAVTDADIASIGLGGSGAGSVGAATAKVSDPPSFGRVIGNMTLALGIVLALMAGAVWIARRYVPQARRAGRGGTTIEILSSRALGGRKSLLLVKARDKTMLLGVSPQGIQFLTEVDQDPGRWTEAALQAGLGAGDAAASGERLSAAGEGF